VQVAKHLGAARIIATGGNLDVLRSLAALGASATIPLGENEAALEESFIEQTTAGVDVVLDYLWGKSAEALLRAAARSGTGAVPMRFVQIGATRGSGITLPAGVLRSSPIQLMGSGLGSVANDRLVHCIGELLKAAGPVGSKSQPERSLCRRLSLHGTRMAAACAQCSRLARRILEGRNL
jgi:NADPH:quinone reductase-like Zn-dependent oxidoreductase